MKKLMKLMEYVYKLYTYQLINCDEAYAAVRKRISDPLIINEFELGLAGSYNELHYEVAHRPDYVSMLIELELIKYSEKIPGYYDTFKERIVFPIRDEFGNAVGLGGWALFYNRQKQLAAVSSDKNVFVPAKYINSANSTLFNKSEVVYHLFQARESIKDIGFVYLAEGFFDVTSIYSSCRKDGKFRQNVVSSMGTGLTRGQATILKTYTDKVLVCYDGDSAGINAALKAIDVLEYVGFKVRISVLPVEHDPDSYFKTYGNLDILDECQLSTYHFRFKLWWETIIVNYDSSKLAAVMDNIFIHFPPLVKGTSRTTICPLIAIMAIDLDISEVTLSLDLCILDPVVFGLPYIFNVKVHDNPVDAEQYFKKAFNQTAEYLEINSNRKEKIAYETVLKLWQQSDS